MAKQGLTIHDILRQLGCRSRPDGGGNYKCRCPAHDDKQESLSVREGEKGIVVKCFAGCSIDSICSRLGMKPADLFWDDQRREPARQKPAGKPKPAARPKPKPPKLFNSIQEAFGYIGEVVKAYPYTTEDGKLVFWSVRIRLPGDKTFRLCRPADPEKGDFPIICSVPAEISGGLIYHLPKVAAAIREGKPIYVVEGEKDVETLESWGLAATTCAGGAKNWKKAHSMNLRGADVVIVPDHDKSGMEHEELVLGHTQGLAKSIRVVHLWDGYPELPEKGDISDLAELAGADRAQAILRELVEKAGSDPYQVAVQAFNAVEGYCINNGCICEIAAGGALKSLCNFVAIPVSEITTDDGALEETYYDIAGWDDGGHPFRMLRVSAAKFRSMDWAMDNWGLIANIKPGSTVKDKLRWAMAEAGRKVRTRQMIYAHCGWREINGKWCYLHAGGCIGADGIQVDMGRDLQGYTLSGTPEGMSVEDAAICSYTLSMIIPARISVPMLGVTYLAPLYEFFNKKRSPNPPSFVTFIKGRHGTHKSGIAALFLNHFGQFGIRGLPANFESSLNGIRRCAFAAKDTVLVIDDYHPATGIKERRRIDDIMQGISRTFGDQALRIRMDMNMKMQVNLPPRGMAVVTGEDLPDVGASGQARMYVIETDKDSLSYDKETKRIWQEANAGALRMAMADYIGWLAPQAEELPQICLKMFEQYRERAHDLIAGSATNDRADDAVAHIMVGLTMMGRWLIHLGFLNEESLEEQLETWWPVVVKNSEEQGEVGREESPTQMFLRAITEMLASGSATVMDITVNEKKAAPKGMIGYVDAQNYYFLGEQTQGAVNRFYTDQNRLFPLSRHALHKLLREEGIVKQIGGDGVITRQKRTPDGRNGRLLWIPRWIIDGTKPPEPEGTQEHMDFKEVPGDDVPEAFKGE